MSVSIGALVGFTAFLVSLLLYLVVARRAGAVVANHPDQYFLSKGAHDERQFAAAQISYALQMATIYPFFGFAFTGSWWLAVWNTLFYALGIVLLYLLVGRFMAGQLKLVGSMGRAALLPGEAPVAKPP